MDALMFQGLGNYGSEVAANGLTLEQFQKSHQEKGEMRLPHFPSVLHHQTR